MPAKKGSGGKSKKSPEDVIKFVLENYKGDFDAAIEEFKKFKDAGLTPENTKAFLKEQELEEQLEELREKKKEILEKLK